ncbi:two pore domain potassium channel family protein [Microlunatus elymi]|uniref:Two pore domain potassium channel family protein n=1 Tax=Microlunatus elymi TaxID=2596828 RepID=A0A516PUK1_9ACTN|nr:potassium channel family protein [Microlunatus elymi]QDP94857.1 two pore domain potassium channel family protein [Microlunatus elymi]
MNGWKRLLRGIVAVVLAVVVYFLVPLGEGHDNVVVRAVLTVTFLLLLVALVIWQMGRQVRDPNSRVDGLALAVVVAVLGFALGFYRMALSQPGQIIGLQTRVDALYFTLTTLLTIGYGDIHAAGQEARVLVIVQMVFNVVVLATAASLLTSRLRTRAEERRESKRG